MKRLLIVVDYQNDFVDGVLGFKRAQEIENNIINKINKYQENNDEIIFTLDTHYEDYMSTVEGENLPIPHCIKGSKGHEIYGKVKELSSNYPLIEKETFGSKDLIKYIENKEYSEIELIGVVTNICVISNAVLVKAIHPNTKISVDASCSASNDEVMEAKALDVLENLHIKVIR